MNTCPYCGCLPHANIEFCPAIAAIEYYPDGAIKRVEKVVRKTTAEFEFGNPAID